MHLAWKSVCLLILQLNQLLNILKLLTFGHQELPPIIQSIANQHYHHKYCVTLQSQDWFLKLYYLEIKWKLISICTLVHPVATGALLHKTDLVKRICHFLHVGCFILPQLSIWERPQNKQQTKVGCGKTFEHSLNSFWHNTGTL